MGHHTDECNIGSRRLRKKFVWFTVARGYFVFFEDIVVEEIYSEKTTTSIFSEERNLYFWKTVKKWPLGVFEEKHGEFKPELAKPHGK